MTPFCEGKGSAGKPHQILDAYPGRSLQHHQRHAIAITQMVMIGDHHAIAQAAFAQRGFEVRDPLVAIVGIVFVRAHRGSSLAAARLVFGHAQIRNLGPAIDHGRNHASDSVLHQFRSLSHSVSLQCSCGAGSPTRPGRAQLGR